MNDRHRINNLKAELNEVIAGNRASDSKSSPWYRKFLSVPNRHFVSYTRADKAAEKETDSQRTIARATRVQAWATVAIFVATCAYVVYAARQWQAIETQAGLMRDQLSEMRSSSIQTDKTIVTLQNQAESLREQVGASRKAANAAMVSAQAFLELQRPVIGAVVKDVDIPWLRDPTQGGKGKITINIFNVGKTAGVIAAFVGGPKIIENAKQIASVKEIWRLDNLIIKEGETVPYTFSLKNNVSPVVAAAVLNKQKLFVFVAEIFYADFYEKVHPFHMR